MSGKKKRKKMRGTVTKVIPAFHAAVPEKAQIDIHEAEALYKEVRIENEVTDEDGDKARLKEGDEVEVVIEATETSAKPVEKKYKQ